MKGRMRSSGKSSVVEAEEDGKAMAGKEVGDTGKRDCDFADENAQLIVTGNEKETPEEEVDMDHGVGLKNEGCCQGGNVFETEVVEETNGRSEIKGESESGGVEKKNNLKGDGANVEVQVVGWVPRCGAMVRTETNKEGDEAQGIDVVVGRTAKGLDGYEKSTVKFEVDHADGEDNYESDNTAMKKIMSTHGRSLSIEENEHEKSDVKPKRKRGRPPKAKEIPASKKKSVEVVKEESDLLAGKQSEQLDNKERGRVMRLRKGGGVNVKVQVVGRVLRSRAVVSIETEKEGDKEHGNDVVVGRRARCRDGYEKKRVEFEKEEIDHADGEDNDGSDNVVKKKIMGKRERSSSSEKNEREQSHDEGKDKVKRRRGRPRKGQERHALDKKNVGVGKEESGQLAGKENDQLDNKVRRKPKRKRPGRPPRAKEIRRSKRKRAEAEKQENDQSAGEESGEPCKKVRKRLKSKRGRPRKVDNSKAMAGLRKSKMELKSKHMENYNMENNGSVSGEGIIEKESKAKKKNGRGKKEKIKKEGNTKTKAGKTGSRKLGKQIVRDKIVELLLGAGWTIDYRPRHDKDYCDAVYVNPEGRTHWSVTLAYRVLKQHYDDGGSDSTNCKPGFKFMPLPENELDILKKVIIKKRSDKNKKKMKWKREEEGWKTVEGAAKKHKQKQKLHMRKHGADARQGNKILKGRPKVLSSVCGLGDSASKLDKGMAVSFRDRKCLKTQDRKGYALMVRNSKECMESDGDGYLLYNGKRTVLTWMIDSGTVAQGGKVQFLKRKKTRAVLTGRITPDGIHCDCCSQIFTISEFETHAGILSCQPLKNIYLETGPSLLECLLETWNKENVSANNCFHFVDTNGEDPNDDTCGICGDGGVLICCDGCPSAFHQSCLDIEKFPSGVWHCVYCTCKFCGIVDGNKCQRDDNAAAAAAAPELFTCCSCEEKYHGCCVQEKSSMNIDSRRLSFCGEACKELFEALQKLFGVRHGLEEGYSWTLVRRFDVGSNDSISGMPQKVECNSKVAVALDIMNECFLPLDDHRSGANLIRNIIYNFGSNFNRLNYSGFLTAILEKGDEIITVASIRIHGNQLAEMPFIGTRHMYRRQGMCRRLLRGIETALCSLNIENLVIPAIAELKETWTSVFGFKPLEPSMKPKMRHMSLMVFAGVDMLQKRLLKHQVAEESVSLAIGLNPAKPQENQTMDETTSNSIERRPSGFVVKGCENSPFDAGMENGEPVAVESGSILPDGSLNDKSGDLKENGNLPECPSTECVDQSGVINDNLEGRNKNIIDPANAVNDDQVETEVSVNGNTVTASIFQPAADTGGEFFCASSKNTEAVYGYSTSDEVITTQPNLVVVQGLKDLEKNVVNRECQTGNISEDVVQSPLQVVQKAEDWANGHCGMLLVDHNVSSSSQDVAYDANQIETAPANCEPSLVASDFTANLNQETYSTNGLGVSTKFALNSCGVDGDYEDKQLSNKTEAVVPAVHKGLMSNGPKMIEHAGSDSEFDQVGQSEHNSESFCNSGSANAVGLHCASGGGNSCGTAEVLILSNQAS